MKTYAECAHILHVLLLQLSALGGVRHGPVDVLDGHRKAVPPAADEMLHKVETQLFVCRMREAEFDELTADIWKTLRLRQNSSGPRARTRFTTDWNTILSI